MAIWKKTQQILSSLSFRKKTINNNEDGSEQSQDAQSKNQNENHLALAKESLELFLNDNKIPKLVQQQLNEDYAELEQMMQKLEQGQVHIVVVGRVSVGKSSLLNALLGEEKFSVSPLHGETTVIGRADWQECQTGGVCLIDTPGLDEVSGESRAKLALDVVSRADLVLFVIDGDLTQSEQDALRDISDNNKPVLLVLNKVDQLSINDKHNVLTSVKQHTEQFVKPEYIVTTRSKTIEQKVVIIDAEGIEQEKTRISPPDVIELKTLLWGILEKEGKTLAALNASLFAGELSDQVNQHVLAVKQSLAGKVVHVYSVIKGVTVAANPIPVTDLLAAAIMDIVMVTHLSRIYGLPLNRREAGSLVKVISVQMLALIGTAWAVNILSSTLKVSTVGISTIITASGQSVIAYYSSYVVGQVAKQYFANGKSWGERGAKQTVAEILEGLDRDSIIADAKDDIMSRLRRS